MLCPRCRTPMVEDRRVHHKQRKWVCPKCRAVLMQKPRPKE